MPKKKEVNKSYRMATGRFIEIWKDVLDKGLMGEDFTKLIREEFDKEQKGYKPVDEYDDKDIWKRIKNKMTAIRQAASDAGVDMGKLPTIRYSHAKSTGRKLDYQGFYDGLASAANPSSGQPYATKVLAKKKKKKSSLKLV